MKRIRSGAGRSRQRPRIGAPDRSLTANAGLAAVTELCDRLGVIGALDAAVGPVKQRDRGFGAGELLAGIAAAQLAGEDFLTGLDRQRADAAGQQITPVPGLASTTAAGLARRVTPAQWRAVESGLAVVTGRMLALLPAERAAALAGGPVTIDLDTTDVEVYGRKKRGVAYNHQGQRVGRPHVAAWAENIFRDSKLGGALRHLPSGYPQVNLAWMWGALLAASMAAWLHQLTARTAGEDIVHGHGVRGGKAMIATLRWRLIAVPGRLVRHARHLVLRLPPGYGLLPEVLARLRDLPAPA